LEAELEKSKEKALYDPLTGVYNRAVFNDRIEKEVNNALKRDKKLTLFILDIDHFKNVNDTYGHQTGDMVLKIIVAQAQKVLREVDLLARYGGEEFAILLPNINIEKATEIANRIRDKISRTKFVYKGKAFKVTIHLMKSRI
jgi:diguanylate cyclase